VSSPDRVCIISVTNFVNGEIDVVISLTGEGVSSGSHTKALTDSDVIWDGALWLEDGEKRYYTFRQPR
jgi:hypothetical protein